MVTMEAQKSKVYHVLFVEDDTLCRQRLTQAISTQPNLKSLAEVGSVREAMTFLRQENTDVLIVDIGLPDGNGLDLIRYCKSMSHEVICLVVTIHGDENHVLEALALGAQGYLLKDAPLSDLGEAMMSAIGGDMPVSPRIAKALLRHLRPPQDIVACHEDIHLTPREIEVLEHLSLGYTRAEIANKLYISIHTVGVHIRHIYKKLQVSSGKKAIRKARQYGIIRTE